MFSFTSLNHFRVCWYISYVLFQIFCFVLDNLSGIFTNIHISNDDGFFSFICRIFLPSITNKTFTGLYYIYEQHRFSFLCCSFLFCLFSICFSFAQCCRCFCIDPSGLSRFFFTLNNQCLFLFPSYRIKS